MITDPADFNADQTRAVIDLQKFLNQDDPRRFFGLFGPAGTGKSTILSYVGHTRVALQNKILVTAPTHKAVGVMREMRDTRSALRDFATIQSALNVRKYYDSSGGGEFKSDENFASMSAANYSVVVVDEASMLNEYYIDLIRRFSDATNVKILYVGDPYQLPPVKEEHKNGGRSLAFKVKDRSVIRTVERSHGAVAAAANAARKQIQTKAYGRIEVPSTDTTERLESEDALLEKYMEDAQDAVILSFRNADVDAWNQRVRTVIHGPTAADFLPGDRVTLAKPFKTVPMGKMFEVSSATYHADGGWGDADIPYWDLRFHGEAYHLQVVTREGYDKVTEAVSALRREIKQAKKKGHRIGPIIDRLKMLEDAFTCMTHGYAMTIHKSQGSTFARTFVDEQYMFSNMRLPADLVMRSKLLYVAYSRASKELYTL